ncbi:MAG: 1-deoxy-D-xylulose-5-phosphate synthase [Lachnospirales bacterium]
MTYLNGINQSSDVKKLSIKELEILAKEIRVFLVKSLSKTGGHLSSNLGVVELTLAMHYVLNLEKNKIIFDVGHQSYTHKILTGRKKEFKNLRKFKGLSGFPKTLECEYDTFNTGHSSTSISAGVGIAESKRLKGEDDKVFVVIGDGALTGGMIYEAINHAGRLKSNICVILNDNEMSISKNVGALSKRLNTVRINKEYIEVKERTESLLKKLPIGSDVTIGIISEVKRNIRNLVSEREIGFFDDLGFKYYGLIDGHNINELVDAMEAVNEIDGPVILHVKTVKGKGYSFSEKNPGKFHGISAFDVKTGNSLKEKSISNSDVFGSWLTKIAKENEKVIGITAAMCDGTGLDEFSKVFPNRFFDVGIAEQHAVTFAGGMAISGFIPVVPIYSSFFQRAYDQIIHDVALQNLHVVFGVDRAGLVGEDGETHQGIFDIAFFSSIPNVKMLAPYTKKELEYSLDYAVNKQKGTIAIRYPRGKAEDVEYYIENDLKYEDVTSPLEVKVGESTCIVGVGNFMKIALNVYDEAENDKLGIVNPRILTEFDKISEILKKYKNIIVLEDGIKTNGYGSILLSKLKGMGYDFDNFIVFAYENFVEQGSVSELLEYTGITVENILNEVNRFENGEI